MDWVFRPWLHPCPCPFHPWHLFPLVDHPSLVSSPSASSPSQAWAAFHLQHSKCSLQNINHWNSFPSGDHLKLGHTLTLQKEAKDVEQEENAGPVEIGKESFVVHHWDSMSANIADYVCNADDDQEHGIHQAGDYEEGCPKIRAGS